jgi:hypothetical protein
VSNAVIVAVCGDDFDGGLLNSYKLKLETSERGPKLKRVAVNYLYEFLSFLFFFVFSVPNE